MGSPQGAWRTYLECVLPGLSLVSLICEELHCGLLIVSACGYLQTNLSLPEHDRFDPETRHQKLDVRFGAESVFLAPNRKRFRRVQKEATFG